MNECLRSWLCEQRRRVDHLEHSRLGYAESRDAHRTGWICDLDDRFCGSGRLENCLEFWLEIHEVRLRALRAAESESFRIRSAERRMIAQPCGVGRGERLERIIACGPTDIGVGHP